MKLLVLFFVAFMAVCSGELCAKHNKDCSNFGCCDDFICYKLTTEQKRKCVTQAQLDADELPFRQEFDTIKQKLKDLLKNEKSKDTIKAKCLEILENYDKKYGYFYKTACEDLKNKILSVTYKNDEYLYPPIEEEDSDLEHQEDSAIEIKPAEFISQFNKPGHIELSGF